MEIHEIFQALMDASGRTDKESILKNNDSPLLRKVLKYTYNPYTQYHLKKVPKRDVYNLYESQIEQMVEEQKEAMELGKEIALKWPTIPQNTSPDWGTFLEILDSLHERKYTGNDAIKLVHEFLSDGRVDIEFWMRRVLERHLNVGITANTINRCFKKLVPSFKVQLAHKFDKRRMKDVELVGFEPKLDGVRCIAIVQSGNVTLHSRNGKLFSDNYQGTIVADLERLAARKKIPQNIVFDGELMGSDFTSTVSQIHRKSKQDVSDQNYHVFDWVPLLDWIYQKSTINCQKTREALEDMRLDTNSTYIKTVHRDVMPPSEIQKMHDVYVADGYEGIMVKHLDTFYKFGRGHNVVKYKNFLDVDLKVIGFEEGVGRLKGTLGAIIVLNDRWDKFPDGVRVNCGSGFSDKDRDAIFNNRSKFRHMIGELRYQECKDPGHGPNGETPDGSLRFPTFLGWRPDKK